jgi:hypothetical protein
MGTDMTKEAPDETKLVVYVHNFDAQTGPTQFAAELAIMESCGANALCGQDDQWSGARYSEMEDYLGQEWGSEFVIHHDINKTEGAPKHGVLVALTAPWSRRVANVIKDERGWARFIGVEIQGESGTLALLSVYVPCTDGADERWQEACIAKLAAEERAPRSGRLDSESIVQAQLRFDLSRVVISLRKRGVALIFAGDYNFTWDEETRINDMSSAQRNRSSKYKQWAAGQGLANMYVEIHGHGAPTFARVNTEDDKDMVLADKGLSVSMRIGVVDHKTTTNKLSGSIHWPVVFSVNMHVVVGVDEEILCSARAQTDGSRLRWSEESRDLRYKEAYAEGCEDDAIMSRLYERVSELEDRACKASTEGELRGHEGLLDEILRANDGLLTEVTARLVKTERLMHVRCKKARRKKRSSSEIPEVAKFRRLLAYARWLARALRCENTARAANVAAQWGVFDTASASRVGVTTIQAAIRDPERRRDTLVALQKFQKETGDVMSRLVQRRAKRDLRSYTERRRGKRQLDSGHLARAVTERVQRGGQYASVVRKVASRTADGSTQDRYEVVSDKVGVASSLVGRFREWMRNHDA